VAGTAPNGSWIWTRWVSCADALARKWYGGDWWFVVISAILLLFIILVGLFPARFAPYDPRVEVGPSLLAPGEPPSSYVLVAPTGSGITSLKDIGTNKNNVGFVVASPASQSLREAVTALNDEAGGRTPVRYNLGRRRHETID
jgi:hypothetical protein